MEDRDQREWERRRKMRSIGIALALAALVVIFYIATDRAPRRQRDEQAALAWSRAAERMR